MKDILADDAIEVLYFKRDKLKSRFRKLKYDMKLINEFEDIIMKIDYEQAIWHGVKV